MNINYHLKCYMLIVKSRVHVIIQVKQIIVCKNHIAKNLTILLFLLIQYNMKDY